MPGPGLACCEAAGGIRGRDLVELRQDEFDDLRAAADRRVSVRPKTAATVPSMPSVRKVPRGRPSRRPFSAMGAGGCGTSSPAMKPSTIAQSATLRASGPAESSEGANGRMPAMVTRRAVGFQPTTPHSAAGMRQDPPVSVPSAAKPNAIRHRYAGTRRRPARQAPRRARSHGLRACRNAGSRQGRRRRIPPGWCGRESRSPRGSVAARRRGGFRHGRAVEHDRARPRGDAGLVVQVLDADRDAGKGARRAAGGAQRVHRGGGCARRLGMHGDEGARAFA